MHRGIGSRSASRVPSALRRLALGLTAAAALAGCYTGPMADHYVAILDELVVPPTWRVAETVVRGPDQTEPCNPGVSNECPAAIRSFVVDADMETAFRQAKDALLAAGFTVGEEATSGCSSGSANGPPCGFFADRASDQIYVGVFASPSAGGLADEPAGPAAVVVRAYSTD